ncbi:phage GP46 family protein [Stutzerimonas kirkiae]|uniref:phage GP46 family protein n=1 Tax=Stutzerimonas kirkiae TaxID=2211392 RepID=UPI001F60059D|nr:phage GP46 family protein [Stutzerimonas kirkiae]
MSLGSRLHELQRCKDLARIGKLAQQYAEQALQPLLDDGRAYNYRAAPQRLAGAGGCPLCGGQVLLAEGKSACHRQLLADSVEKVVSAAACRSGVPAVGVAASHFKLPFGVSLSVLAQV